MDLALYVRVIWRFRWLMALGLVLGVGVAYLLYTGAGGTRYTSRAQVFITQTGFTWGSGEKLTSASADSNSSSGAGSQQVSPTSSQQVSPTSSQQIGSSSAPGIEYAPGIDTQRLSSLASLYAQLASGSALPRMLAAPYPEMLSPASGKPTATLTASAVQATEFSNPAILPIISFWATAPSPSLATRLANDATVAFQRLLTAQQTAVPSQSRVIAQTIRTATPATLTNQKSKSLPIMVFLASFLAAFGLSLILENVRPRSAEHVRKRNLPRRRQASTAASGKTSVAARSRVGERAELFQLRSRWRAWQQRLR